MLAMISLINGRAATPLLEWDANSEPGIAGYHVYRGTTSRNYSQVVDVGLQTSFPLTNLNAGTTYFFAVTAYDTNRLESMFSDELWYTPRVDGISATVLPCTFSVGPATVSIRFSGQLGQRCHIVASSDLRQWEEVYSLVLTGSSPMIYSESRLAVRPVRFYRVIASQL